MNRLICQKPAHFLSAQMALVSSLFQMFEVLGMYNFGLGTKKAVLFSAASCKKDIIFGGHPKQIFGSSSFVKALVTSNYMGGFFIF